MKKLFIFIFGILAFTASDVQAAEWKEGELVEGLYRWDIKNPSYSITLEEDAEVTFTLKDGVNNYRGYPDANRYSVSIANHGTDKPIATMSTDPNDGDEEKTVQSVNLKKGSYKITIISYTSNGPGDFAVSYTTGPINGTDIEPNNVNAMANPYTLGATYQGVLYDEGISDDHDIYKVDIPTFGKLKLILEGRDATRHSLVTLTAFNEHDKKIFTFKSSDPNEMEILLQPGTYYFKINLGGFIRKIGYYTFSTNFVSLPPQDWESGLNTQSWTADTLKNNKTINGFVYDSGFGYAQIDDYYTFTLAKDAKVTFIANAFDSLGALLFKDDEGLSVSPGYVTSDTRQIAETKQLKAGTYYVSYRTRYGDSNRYEGYNLTMRIESFKDIPVSHPYYGSIEALAQLGINKGSPDGNFYPKQAIQRKHVFSLLNRLDSLQLKKIRPMKTFKDLPASHPFYQDIKAFYEAGIIDGGGLYMTPESNLTRAQMAKILVNTFNLKMKGKAMQFTDVTPSNSFHNYVQILASNGITVGANGKFMPNEPVTREQFSAFLHRTLEMQ